MKNGQSQSTGDGSWAWLIAREKASGEQWQFLAERLTTYKIFHLLIEQGEMYQTEIARAVALTPSGADHATKPLKRRGLIKIERRGNYLYYSLKPEAIADYQRWRASQQSDKAEQ